MEIYGAALKFLICTKLHALDNFHTKIYYNELTPQQLLFIFHDMTLFDLQSRSVTSQSGARPVRLGFGNEELKSYLPKVLTKVTQPKLISFVIIAYLLTIMGNLLNKQQEYVSWPTRSYNLSFQINRWKNIFAERKSFLQNNEITNTLIEFANLKWN